MALRENPAACIPLAERRRRVEDIAPETTLHGVLESLFRSIPGVDWVEVTHGSEEFGKDLLVCSRPAFGTPDYTAVVVKLGKISGAAAGSSTLGVVKRQIDQAATVPYKSTRLKDGIRPNRILVVCTGSISNNAKTEIVATAPTGFLNVDFWSGQELEEQLFTHYPEFFVDVPIAVGEYLKRFEDKHCDVTLEHRRLGGNGSKTIFDVFVEPTMMFFDDLTPPVGGSRAKLGATKLVVNLVEKPQIFGSTELTRPRENIFVIGPPGCGKSTALRKAALDLARANYSGAKDVPFPMFATAGELLLHLGCDTKTEAFLRSMPVANSMSLEELDKQLREKPSVLYLDGLDEVAARESEVLDFVGELATAFPKMRVVCSARLSYFQRPKSLPGFRQALMLPMNVRAMRELIEKILGKGRKSTDILRAVLESGLHLSLPQTPLVVTILALLHEQEYIDEIPSNLADLYDMVMQVYLGRWSPGQFGGRSGIEEYNVKVELLKRIALEMHLKRRTSLPLDELQNLAADYLRSRGHADLLGVVLESLHGNAGVLQLMKEDGEDQESVAFIHLSFQEFFAARRLDDKRDMVGGLTAQFSDPWWGNVLTFYAGIRKDVPEIVDAIIDGGLPANPMGALSTSLQLGHLLQASSSLPVATKERGCLYGTDLAQAFYTFYAQQQKSGKVAVRFSRLQMMFAVSVLFGVAYGSQHLSDATDQAFERLLNRFTETAGEERFLCGLRLLALANARAATGDWAAIELFVMAARDGDFPLLQTAAAVLEAFSPPEGEQGRWDRTVRAIRKFAPKGGIDALRRLDVGLKPIETETHLLDARADPGSQEGA